MSSTILSTSRNISEKAIISPAADEDTEADVLTNLRKFLQLAREKPKFKLQSLCHKPLHHIAWSWLLMINRY